MLTKEVARLLQLAEYLARFDPGARWTLTTTRDRYGKLGLVKARCPSMLRPWGLPG